MKICVVIGTRPECIKLAPVIQELKKNKNLSIDVIATGQHREMVQQFLKFFNIEVTRQLEVMVQGQSLSELTARLFQGLEQILSEVNYDWVIAQGDTTTVMVASMVSFYRKVKFAHVEAGLRSFDVHAPFPEELNRRVTSLVADVHFSPTQLSADNLIHEGISPEKIMVIGNTVVDALLQIAGQPYKGSVRLQDMEQGESKRKRILLTAHRRENFGENLKQIFEAVLEVIRCRPDVEVIYPVHSNPNVLNSAKSFFENVPNVRLIEPLDYLDLVFVMKNCDLILTDSGGIQEEAPTFGVPLLVLRDTTERPEGVNAGVSKLVGANKERIVKEALEILEKGEVRISAQNPYGDGKAAGRIAGFFGRL